METLIAFWANDGVLEFPFHPPDAVDRVEGIFAIAASTLFITFISFLYQRLKDRFTFVALLKL